MDEEQPLPAFRIPQLTHAQHCQPDDTFLTEHERHLNTVIAMRRKSYDKLLAENSKAALRYFDDIDGEDVTVGSALELEQRLQEDVDGVGNEDLMHAFDIARSEEVKKTWGEAARERRHRVQPSPSLSKGDPAANPLVHDPRQAYAQLSSPPGLHLGSEQLEINAQEKTQEDSMETSKPGTKNQGSLTPKGQQQARQAAAILSHASRVNQIVQPPQSLLELAKARWEAYGAVPGDFTEKKATMTPQLKSTASSNLPSKPADQPLLDLFHDRLVKLRSNNQVASQSSPFSPRRTEELQPTVEDGEVTQHVQDQQPTTPQPASASVLETSSPPMATTPEVADTCSQSASTQTHPTLRQPAAEAITKSMKCLLEGISSLTTGVLDANPDIHRGFVEAQHDFPRNIEKALKASTAAFKAIRERERAAIIPRTARNENARQSSIWGTHRPQPVQASQSTRFGLATDESGWLAWQSREQRPDAHSAACLKGCSIGVQSRCPVKDAVQRAYDIMISAESGSAKPTKEVELCEAPVSEHEVRDKADLKQATEAHKPLQSSVHDNQVRADKAMPVWAQPSRAFSTKDEQHRPTELKATEAGADSHRLRHRRSWHPASSSRPEQDTRSFDFSPAAVMEKFPPVTTFEAPDAEPSSKSVKFGKLPDPWEDKKRAQKAWADRYPDAKVSNLNNSFVDNGGCQSEHNNQCHTNQPECLDSNSEYTSKNVEKPNAVLDKDQELYGPPSPPLATKTTQNPVMPFAGAREPKTMPLRHSKSVGFVSRYMPTHEVASEDKPAAAAGNDERERRPYSYIAPDTSATSTGLRGARTTTAPPPDSSTHGAWLRGVRRHVAPMPSMPELSRGAHGFPSHRAGRLSRSRIDDNSNDLTRRTNIAHCVSRLVSMGFGRHEAATVAESVAGDVESAIDVLEEDRRAREEVIRKQKQEQKAGEEMRRESEEKRRQSFKAREEVYIREREQRQAEIERENEQRKREKADQQRQREKEHKRARARREEEKQRAESAPWGPENFLGDLIGAFTDGANGGRASGNRGGAGSGAGSDAGPSRFPSVPGAFPGAVQDVLQGSGLFGQSQGRRSSERQTGWGGFDHNDGNGGSGATGGRRNRARDGEWW